MALPNKQVKQGLVAARRRLVAFEKSLIQRGKAQQREMERLVKRVVEVPADQLTRLTAEVRQKAEVLQTSIRSVLGIASSEEIAELHRELARLAKRVDRLASRKKAAA